MSQTEFTIRIKPELDKDKLNYVSNLLKEQLKDIKIDVDFSGAFAKSILQALDSFKLIADNVTKMMQDLENTT